MTGDEFRGWLTLAIGVMAVIAALLQWHASVDATREASRLAREQQAAAMRLEAVSIVMEQRPASRRPPVSSSS